MIDHLAEYVRHTLERRKLGVPVSYTERLTPGLGTGNRVIFERPREAGETISFPRGVGSRGQARRVAERGVTGKVTIYGQSSADGATVGGHERVADAIVDATIAAMVEWAKRARLGQITWLSAGFLPAPEGDTVEVWPGVKYEIRFRVGRGVFGPKPERVRVIGVETEVRIARPGDVERPAPGVPWPTPPTEPGEPPYGSP
jgi:hypothetical protein